MARPYQQFIFEDYAFDAAASSVLLRYSLDGQIFFTEKISWDIEPVKYNPDVLERALFALWIMAGISYYKTYLPAEIVLKKGSLNAGQKEFFDSVYLNGLAQFFYTNHLDWQGVINFPYNQENETTVKESTGGSGALMAVGGGKDSIVAAELADELGIDYVCWVVNQADRFKPLTDTMDKPVFSVSRHLDPQLAELNVKGAYNGHVPITAIISFIGVVLALLTGKKSLLWANEASADEPNTIWNGLEVNHQYSKTSFFEKDMQNYIRNYIASDLEYYSILRPLSELRIAEIFCKKYFIKYQKHFSSCNANFTQGSKGDLKWCGQCPKCAFVFAIFSPFLKKDQLVDLFDGKNLFLEKSLRPTFEELLGLGGSKPLECVGEVAEVRQALQMSKESDQYPELKGFKFPKPNYDYRAWHTNNIPASLESQLKSILQ